MFAAEQTKARVLPVESISLQQDATVTVSLLVAPDALIASLAGRIKTCLSLDTAKQASVQAVPWGNCTMQLRMRS